MRSEDNGIHVLRNCVLEVTELPKALETSFEGDPEAVEKDRLVRVAMRGEINGIRERWNCALKVTQLPEALETSDQAVAEVV
jgi:hypothetical protein